MKPIWPYLFAVVPIGTFCYVVYRAWPWWGEFNDGWFERKMTIFLPLFVGLLVTGFFTAGAGALGYGLADVIGSHADQVWHQCWHARLASMRSSDGTGGGISGSLFMISGFIDSAQVYYYYVDKGGNSYQPDKWYATSRTTIYEEDRNDAEVFQFDCKFKRGDWMEWFANPSSNLRMDFHIPAGSIRKEFRP